MTENQDEFIEYKIVTMHNTPCSLDQTFLPVFQKLFEWSNKMGLNGCKVKNLKYIDQKKENCDPCNVSSWFECKISNFDDPLNELIYGIQTMPVEKMKELADMLEKTIKEGLEKTDD